MLRTAFNGRVCGPLEDSSETILYSNLMEAASQHQAAARIRQPSSTDSLLISAREGHNYTVGISGSQVEQVLSVFMPSRRRGRPTSQEEAHAVFSEQPRDRLPVFTLKRGNTLAALPGRSPLLDHLRAYVDVRPDWSHHIAPLLRDLAESRHGYRYGVRELVLGVSSDDAWEDAAGDVLEMSARDKKKGILFVAADTEGYQAKVDWPTDQKGLQAILERIHDQILAGKHSTSFTSGHNNGSAANFPVRFFIGSGSWAVHIKLPVQYYAGPGGSRLLLDLTTKLTPAVKSFFAGLPPMVGFGIMADFVCFAKVTSFIWDDPFFTKVPLPIEIGDMIHLAGIAMPQSSMFASNWWVSGTLLPKDQGSRGDNLWGLDLDVLPKALEQYLICDTRQPAITASVLLMIWCVHHFPDAYWVNQVSEMSPLAFFQWVADNVFAKLLPHIRPVEYLDHGDSLLASPALPQLRQPELISSYSQLLGQMRMPADAKWDILCRDPRWPAITAGGPCFLHAARMYMNSMLPLLRAIDPRTWALGQVDQLVHYQFGITSESYSYPLQASLNTGPWEVNPGVENPIVSDFATVTKDSLKGHINPSIRGSRAMLIEYVRLYPWVGRDMLIYFEEHTRQFKELVGEKRFRKVVLDIRRCLEFMGLLPDRPEGWKDPFFAHHLVEKTKENVKRALKRRRDHLSSGLESNTSQLAAVKAALVLAEDPTITDVSKVPAICRWNENQSLLRPTGVSNAEKCRKAAVPLSALTAPEPALVWEQSVPTTVESDAPPARRQRLGRIASSLDEEIELFIDQSEAELFG